MKSFTPSKNRFPIFIELLVFFSAGCGNKPDDTEIQQHVMEQLNANPNFKDVNATVENGIVRLDGKCEGENCVAEVEQKVKEIQNVDSVENNVQLKETETDLTLRSSVQNIISKYEGVQADVAAGVIVLRGTINRNQLQPLMNELSALSPKKIDKQLAVQ
jgi:osmotically-inducible protein OsmY